MSREKDFTVLIEQSKGIIYKVIRLYVNDREDEKDLYQEILYQAWHSFPNFKGNSKFSTWLYRVALNTVLTYKRKIRKHSDISEVNQPVALGPSDDTEALYLAIRSLGETDRMIIALHLDGYNNDEIGEIAGMTKNHVGVKLYRIKEELGRKLKQ